MCAQLYDSLQSHGRYHTRLLCPWNFPGKNTGMDFLINGPHQKKKKILKKYKKLAPGSAVNLGLCLLAAVSGEWKELPSFPQKMSGRSIVNCHWRRGILFLNMFCVIQHFPCEDAAFVSCKIILMEMRYWNFTLQLLACPLKII